MKRVLGLTAFGCVLAGVESKLLRWSDDVYAKRWTPARETHAARPMLGTSPKPTDPPQLAAEEGLDRRAEDDNTCAYIEGSVDYPLYCATTARCVFNSRNSHIGCCADGVSDCPLWTTCYALTESADYTTNNGYSLWCGESSYPNCIKHQFQDDSFSGYTLWGCAVAKGSDSVYYTATDSGSTTSDSTTAVTTSESTRSSDRSSTTSSIDGGGNSDGDRDGDKDEDDDDDDDDDSGVPVGPVVGGVIGGVAALGLIGLGAFILIRSTKKKNTQTTPPPNMPGSTPGQGPPPGPSDSGYPPQMAHQSYYAPGVAGFTPVDQRNSMAKYGSHQPGYDGANIPGSPTPTYQSGPTPPPGGYNQPSPPLSSPQEYQAAQQQGFQNTPPQGFQGGSSPQQGYQTAAYNQGGPYPPPGQPQQGYGFAAELPVTRGDGEVRELSG